MASTKTYAIDYQPKSSRSVLNVYRFLVKKNSHGIFTSKTQLLRTINTEIDMSDHLVSILMLK